MWNPFKKNNSSPNEPQMGMLQKLAMKRLEKMDPEERQKLMQKILSPENLAKNKDKIVETLEQMKQSRQISPEQAEEAKKRLGL